MQYSTLFLKLLERRGFTEDFLQPKYERLTNPFLLPDMKKAMVRIKRAVTNAERILVYGDYDVDGVTATAIMWNALTTAGVDKNRIVTMLPDRFADGYGMSKKIVQKALTEKIELVITVDCGSNNNAIINELTSEGIDVIVTDHHEIMGDLPEATAVLNAKRTDVGVPQTLRQLCGAGVAFFLARAMAYEGLIPNGQEKWLLDLAMIGTICDAMELTGDNRTICRFGMIVLAKTRRAGLRQLMKIARVQKIDTEAIGFQLGPRLNAAGRMESAEISLRLLLTTSEVEAINLAEELEKLNIERKNQQEAAVREIEKHGISDEPVIVVTGDWHEGVLGIIAGKLTEKYKKPSFVLAETPEGELKGSGRSFGEFNLTEAIKACDKCLISGGGHAEACGVKLKKERLADFVASVNDFYRGLGLKNQERFLEVKEDLKIRNLGSLTLDFMGELELLEPFGNGNPEPSILLDDMEVVFVDRIGKEGKHLKLTIKDTGENRLRLVAFSAPEDWFELKNEMRISLIVQPMVNEWNGVSSVEGRILSVKK